MEKVLLELISNIELLVRTKGFTVESNDLVFTLRLLINSFLRTGEVESATTVLLLERLTGLSSSLTDLPQ
jgi:hypothetical protein